MLPFGRFFLSELCYDFFRNGVRVNLERHFFATMKSAEFDRRVDLKCGQTIPSLSDIKKKISWKLNKLILMQKHSVWIFWVNKS